MSQENNSTQGLRGISRRRFLGLAAAGLLAGCTSTPQPAATPTSAPPATPPPTPAPAATPTSAPAAVSAATGRPEIFKFYPEVPSQVVHTHHAGVWQGDQLSPEALRQMLDASITSLTGLNDAGQAWAALFKPTEKIAIKVNVFRNSLIWTHVPLVLAVTDSLQAAGIPPEQIVIFDYYTDELETAGYPVNQDGPGLRCYGTDQAYTEDWTVQAGESQLPIKLSDILLTCDALINMPVLKSHMISGLTFALKNHYGSVNRPDMLHYPIDQAIAGLNALSPIKDRTRLVVGDILEANLKYSGGWPYWKPDWKGDSILLSFDPVAHDAVGMQILERLQIENEATLSSALRDKAMSYLKAGAELGLGAADPNDFELVEVKLG